MSYIVNDIADYLEDESVGTVGTDIFVGNLPDSPDTAICIIDTGGIQPSIDIPTKRPTFQVLIRGETYAAGKNLVDTIRGLLHNQYNVTLVSGGNYFYSINLLAEGGHIGKNDRGLDEFSMNFQAYTR